MKKIFIAGGAGLIGSHLTKIFLNKGHEVCVFDNHTHYFFPQDSYAARSIKYRDEFLLRGSTHVRGNILDISDLRRKVLDFQPDVIVNLAALPLATVAVKNSEEAYSSILDGAHNFLEILRDFPKLGKYIHISSSMIYGDFMLNPNPEDAKKAPKEIYGSMKLASEHVVAGYTQRYGIDSVVIRPTAVYGPTDFNRRVLQIFVEAALSGKPISANDPGSNYLDFTYVEDIAMGISLAALSNNGVAGDCFNISRGEGRSLLDAINILKESFPNLEINSKEGNGFYPKRGALDIQKAKTHFGYDPKFSLEDGIKNYISFYKEHLL